MRYHLAVLFALAASTASAADLTAPSRVDAVTVYPDGATVTRVLTFEVPAGETTLVARDFPLGLDPASIRLQGQGDRALTIGSVDAKRVFVDAPGPDAALEKTLRDLNDSRAAIDGEIAALTVKKGFIERVAGGIDVFGKGDNARPVDPALLRSTWGVVGEDLAAANEAIRVAEVKRRDIDEAIARAEAARDGRGTGAERMELRIAVSAEAATKGTVAVSYLIGSAGWTPGYDARLDTATSKLELVRRASVAQSTGEDWTDVAMTISTARATGGAAAPVASPIIVSFLEPMLQRTEALDESAPMQIQRKVKNMEAPAMSVASPAPAPKVDAVEQFANLETGGFQSVWQLPGRVSVQSGPSNRSLLLGRSSVDAKMIARTVPAIDPTAFLEASFIHQAETPLYPGQVAIYRDGLYAGQSSLALSTTGETIRLGFGADDSIKIARTVAKRSQSESGIVTSTRNDRREYVVTIRNGRAKPVTVSVEEATPVSETADIRVEPTAASTPPTIADADGRRGVLVWTRDVAAGGTETISIGYTISWPAARQINLAND